MRHGKKEFLILMWAPTMMLTGSIIREYNHVIGVTWILANFLILLYYMIFFYDLSPYRRTKKENASK